MLIEEKDLNIGRRIREQRKRKNLTQFMLAEKVGLHEKQISRIESGLNYPTLISFIKIIKTLDMDLSDFINKETPESDPPNQLRDDILNIIKSADNKELKIYLDILKPLKKNLKNYNPEKQ